MDFQNKKGRLTKRDYKADFKLADSDDFFGFSNPVPVSKTEKIMMLVLLPYVVYFLYQAIIFIF